MAKQRRVNGISRHVVRLLNEGEGQLCDFKRSPEAISTDDLVAFANTEAGGSVLAGVEERAGPGGAQVGFVVGCDVTDATVLQIANKALSCFPPVALEISIENLRKSPFLRIDVPPSTNKPHCTPKGVYCRRDGSRNRPIHPSELLKIFLESESRAFSERFESAADRVTNDILRLQENLDESIRAMADQLGWADSKLDDTESSMHSILSYTQRLNTQVSDLTTRIRTLFQQDKRDDPVRSRERKKLLDEFVARFQSDKALRSEILKNIKSGGTLSFTISGLPTEEFTQEELSGIFHESVKIFIARYQQESSQAKRMTGDAGDATS